MTFIPTVKGALWGNLEQATNISITQQILYRDKNAWFGSVCKCCFQTFISAGTTEEVFCLNVCFDTIWVGVQQNVIS